VWFAFFFVKRNKSLLLIKEEKRKGYSCPKVVHAKENCERNTLVKRQTAQSESEAKKDILKVPHKKSPSKNLSFVKYLLEIT
jgi:hypothetical protein